MSRPTNKKDLITAAKKEYEALMTLLSSVPKSDIIKPFTFSVEHEKQAHWNRDKNVRDVLAHLYEWHQLLLTWVETNTKGTLKPFLPTPYNWRTYGGLNVDFWEKHQKTSYDDIYLLLEKSHQSTMKLVDKYTDEALFNETYFPWTGSSPIGAYVAANTSSHYAWAIKKIKKHIKTLNIKK